MAQYVNGVEGIPDGDRSGGRRFGQMDAICERSARFRFRRFTAEKGGALREYERRDLPARSSSVVVTTEREARLMRAISFR